MFVVCFIFFLCVSECVTLTHQSEHTYQYSSQFTVPSSGGSARRGEIQVIRVWWKRRKWKLRWQRGETIVRRVWALERALSPLPPTSLPSLFTTPTLKFGAFSLPSPTMPAKGTRFIHFSSSFFFFNKMFTSLSCL